MVKQQMPIDEVIDSYGGLGACIHEVLHGRGGGIASAPGRSRVRGRHSGGGVRDSGGLRTSEIPQQRQVHRDV